jgi:alkyldihydroxyacetonephosphate synthase
LTTRDRSRVSRGSVHGFMQPARPQKSPPDQSWRGWGDAANVAVLPEAIVAALGAGGAAPVIEPELPAPRLTERVLGELAGACATRADDRARLLHTRGKSTTDLLRIRSGEAADAPDLVALPESHEQVLELLRICTTRRVAVVPFGGGTSVVGGLEPRSESFAGTIALDTRRMNALLDLDEESRLARLQPGLRGPQAEALLAEHGYTIGHFPQSFEYATLGGFAAARSSGQGSAGYGRFDELVLALEVATPAGTIKLGRAPRTATGPDLRQLFLGSEGALGIITSLSVQVRPAPERRWYEGWRFASFRDGAAVVRRLAQDGPRPTVLRLSDEAETAIGLAQPGELGAGGAGSLAIVGFEGDADEAAERQAGVRRILEQARAELVPGAGEGWLRDRYRGPYLRDALLNAGALADTLETATFWSAVPDLYEAVSKALRESLSAQGTPPVVLCHISHVYPAGASLYFTVACAQTSDPVAQWRAAKAAAGEAIIAAGGTISHHHGVGRDHVGFYELEIGSLAVQALRAVKATFDPAGILNPGILIPRE